MILMAGRDARPQFPVGPFYVKGCQLLGFTMFNATPDDQRAAADDINRWLAAGQLKPLIDRVLPLSEAAQSHRLQEGKVTGQQGEVIGKIVLAHGLGPRGCEVREVLHSAYDAHPNSYQSGYSG